MAADVLALIVIGIGLFIFLLYALLQPEKF
jgi:K+-transporting ATPase KdpF subunit